MVELGLPESAFWRLTPVRFFALVERHRERIARDDLRAGVIAATVVNLFAKKDGEPALPFDFFPWHKDEEKEKERKQEIARRKLRQQQESMRAWAAAVKHDKKKR